IYLLRQGSREQPSVKNGKGDTMQVTLERVGDVAVVEVGFEELDASNADEFRRQMTPVLEGARKVVLDLGPVQLIDSRGCGAILSCLKTLSAAGGDLRLCNVNRPVRTTFELIRLHRVCEILNTKDDAVRSFAS